MSTMTEREPTELELEHDAEPTPEDLAIEAEESLTVPEQRWLDDLELRAKEWKHDTSKQPYRAQGAVRKLHLDDFTVEDIELWRVFRSLQRNANSLYFKQRFGRLLRARVRDTHGDTSSTSYQLTKVLESLHESSQEE